MENMKQKKLGKRIERKYFKKTFYRKNEILKKRNFFQDLKLSRKVGRYINKII